MHRIAHGGLAGLLATGLMTLVVVGGRAAGLLRTPPPAEITARVEEEVGVRRHVPEPAFRASWLAAHFGYGAACGIVYALLRPGLPAVPIATGLTYGGAVWVLSYVGFLPALGLYPWPEEDSRSRMAVMIAAHAVFGVTVAEAERRLAAG